MPGVTRLSPNSQTLHVPLSSLAATLMEPPRKCCKQKTYARLMPQLNPLDATLTKNPGEGDAITSHWSYRHTGTLPRLISFVSHSYENTGGVGVFFPFWNSQPANLPTCKLSNSPVLLLRAVLQQVLQLAHELLHVLEVHVHRRKPHVRHLIQFFQAVHDHFADFRGCQFAFRGLLHHAFDFIHDSFQLWRSHRPSLPRQTISNKYIDMQTTSCYSFPCLPSPTRTPRVVRAPAPRLVSPPLPPLYLLPPLSSFLSYRLPTLTL